MDETLKSLQLGYRLLMTICLAVFVLLFSINHGDTPSEAALRELHQIAPTLDAIGDREVLHMRNDYKPFVDALREAIHGIDVSNLSIVSAITANGAEMQFTRPHFLGNQDKPIDAYYQYLKSAIRFDGYTLYHVKTQDLIDVLTALAKKNHLSRITEVSLGEKPDTKNGYKPIDGKCVVFVSGSIGSAARAYAFGEGEQEPGVPCTKEYRHLLKEDADLLISTGLIEKKGDEYNPLPKLGAIWDDVKGKDISLLADQLGRRALSERQQADEKLDILGFAIKENIVLFIVPALILGLLLFMVALVRFVRNSSETYVDEAVYLFYWFGLARDWLGFSFLFVSLVIVPAVAGTMLIVDSSSWSVTSRAAMAIPYTLFELVTSGYILHSTRKVAGLQMRQPATVNRTC